MNFRTMTAEERTAFLAEPGRPAVLAIGDLLACPVWYYPHGQYISFMTSSTTRKAELLALPSKLILCVQDYSTERICYATVYGAAEVYHRNVAPGDLPRRIASRYLEGNSLDAFLEQNIDDLAVRVRPYKVVGKILEA